jgi:hypothetical protein
VIEHQLIGAGGRIQRRGLGLGKGARPAGHVRPNQIHWQLISSVHQEMELLQAALTHHSSAMKSNFFFINHPSNF